MERSSSKMLSTAKNDIEIPRQARNDTFDCFVKNVNNAVNSYNLNVFLHTTVNNHTTIIALKKLENLLKLSYRAYSMLFKAFFKGVRRPQKRLLVKPFGRELSADRKRLATRLALAPASLAESRRARQALLDSTHRKRNGRNTSQIRRYRINIREIHLERVIAFLAEAEGRSDERLDSFIPEYILWYMQTTVMFKTDKKRKEAVQRIAREMGLSFSTVMNEYMREFIEKQEITFRTFIKHDDHQWEGTHRRLQSMSKNKQSQGSA